MLQYYIDARPRSYRPGSYTTMDIRFFIQYLHDVDAGLRERNNQLEEYGDRLMELEKKRLDEKEAILAALMKVNDKRKKVTIQSTRAMTELTELLRQQAAELKVELRQVLGLWPERPPPGLIRGFVRRAFREGFRIVVVYILAIMNIVFIGALTAALHVFVPAWAVLSPYPPWVSVMIAVLFVWRRRAILFMFAVFGGSMLVLVLAGIGAQVRELVGL